MTFSDKVNAFTLLYFNILRQFLRENVKCLSFCYAKDETVPIQWLMNVNFFVTMSMKSYKKNSP